MMIRLTFRTVVATFAVFSAAVCLGEVVGVEIDRREPFAGGRGFGDVGAYERISGRVFFAVDPDNPANATIVDLPLAPRNPQGLVEFSADFDMLRPVDLQRGNGAILYEVNNRGNKTLLAMFNDAGGNDPQPGNAFLMEQGYTLVWSGWIAETLPGEGRLILQAPVATDDGAPIRGLVRAEMAPDAPAGTAERSSEVRLNIAHWADQGSFRPTERGLEDARLTWRLCEADPRVPIPREQFRMHVTEVDGAALPLVELELPAGFRAGYLYELIYEAEGPIVQGLGLAGIRDLVSFLRYDRSAQNPLLSADAPSPRPSLQRGQGDETAGHATRAAAPHIDRAYAFGTSQSGRCLRQFLYDGFNADEQGRQVFELLWPHVAGAGLGFFNHRFASPTRHNGQHDNHSYPADVYPFAYTTTTDPFSGRDECLLDRAAASGTVPLIVQTQSSAEYWTRAASLVHTDPLGEADLALPENVRLYVFGGCQHGPGSEPPREGNGQLLTNPSDYRPFLRGLLVAADGWARDGTEPPPSVYPTLSDGTLVHWRQSDTQFPFLPGVRYPEVIQQPSFWDYGERWLTDRVMSVQPPVPAGDYRVLVPRSDDDGNDLGVLRLPRITVPLATYTGWNLRRREIGAETELLSLAGGCIPLPRTAAEREATGDPRLSIQERYNDFDEYVARFTLAAQLLVEQGYLLPGDAERMIADQEQYRNLFP